MGPNAVVSQIEHSMVGAILVALAIGGVIWLFKQWGGTQMLNVIQIAGRLGHDPELRYTPSGWPVTTFSIACDRDFKENGEQVTDWVDIVCWRQKAEFAANYLTKGRMINVSGRLQTRTYTGADGIQRKAFEIVAEHIYAVDSPRPQQTAVGMVAVQAPIHTQAPQVMVAAGYAPEEPSDNPFAGEDE
jgi:single-strand DNA-binding protein